MTPAARLSAAIELIDAIDDAARSRGQGAEGVGHRAPLCRLRRPRRDRRPGLGRAAPPRFQRLDHGRRHAARRGVLGMLRLERGMDADAIAALCDGEPLRAGAADRGRALGADRRARSTDAPAAYRRRLSGMARRASGGGVRRRPRRGGRRDGAAARRSTCASTR